MGIYLLNNIPRPSAAPVGKAERLRFTQSKHKLTGGKHFEDLKPQADIVCAAAGGNDSIALRLQSDRGDRHGERL